MSRQDSPRLPQFTPGALRTALDACFTEPRPRDFIVAFSGGRDSRVLLDALVKLSVQDGIRVTAAHFNHELQPDSERWQAFCERCCSIYGVPFLSGHATKQEFDGENTEAEARRQRYDWLESIAGIGQVVLSAHHRDDQAETFLHHLLQGKGIAQLAGVKRTRSINHGSPVLLARPLLDFPGASIQAYAEECGLDWIEDPSNLDTRYQRNFLRRELLPLLRKQNPGIDNLLERGFKACQKLRDREASLYRDMVDAARSAALGDTVTIGDPLEYSHFVGHGDWVFHGTVRTWVHQAGLRSPKTATLDQLYRLVGQGQSATGSVDWDDYRIWVYRKHLYLSRNLDNEKRNDQPWPDTLPGVLAGHLRLTVHHSAGGFDQRLLEDSGLKLRWRRGGEKMTLPGRTHRSSIKKLHQANNTPPWIRDWLPMVVREEEIVWVPGLGASAGCLAQHETGGVEPDFAVIGSD